MALHLGDTAPDFSADSSAGPIAFHEWAGIALSVDSAQDHAAWIPDIEQYNATSVEYPIIADPDKSVAELYDMIHPGEGDTSSVRSVFVIDPAKKVRLQIDEGSAAAHGPTAPVALQPEAVDVDVKIVLIGSVEEYYALQEADRGECATPVDWQVGDRIIVPPTVSTPDAIAKFDDVEVVYPYLRTARVKADAAGAGAVGCD